MAPTTEKYMTEDGVELTLRAVRPVQIEMAQEAIRQEWRDAGRMVDPPQFKIQFERKIGTAEIWVNHRYDPDKGIDTLTVPDDPQQTALNHALWAQYQKDSAELEAHLTEVQFRLFITFGVECEMPEDETWVRQTRAMGIKVPDDPDERRFLYIWTFLLSPSDKAEVTTHIQFLSLGRLATENKVASFRTAVRSSMERALGTQIDRIVTGFEEFADQGTGEFAQRLGPSGGGAAEGLVGEPAPPRDAGGEVGGPAPARKVGQP